ncbi:hypothetical protein EDB81DRAFT_758580 [Dactylonectria macrodidyma]|uniref:ZZ-type domain-containing protein n=1 Tax=Dactylonectria macrodidyma TaxID=307937 RepID=A0A9P9F6B8_9HYPO|nr:hypothetical protein EDB81DRAFT_758580 [Dactylonectria macrodidyma]
MSFIDKFKREFGGLSVSDSPSERQQAACAGGSWISHRSWLLGTVSVLRNDGQQIHHQPYNTQQQPQYQPNNTGQEYQYLPCSSGQTPVYDVPQPVTHRPLNAVQQPYTYRLSGLNTSPQQWQQPSTAPRPNSAQSGYQQTGSSPSLAGSPFAHPSLGSPAFYNGEPQQLVKPLPYNEAPQALAPCGGASHALRGSAWEGPSNVPPLPPMPAYAGSSSRGGPFAQEAYNQGLQIQVETGSQMAHLVAYDGKMKSASQTVLAATGGLIAGGVAGYFIQDALDKRKKKKLHGRVPDDFSDFASYPGLTTNLECNDCDRAIHGLYAHCAKCGGGDYDICRNCLAQGVTCEGRGKHRLVKVYPEYECNECGHDIQGHFYHCSVCDLGEWDLCEFCLERGKTCNVGGGHRLVKLFLPAPNYGSGKHCANSDSSSGSDSD